MQKLSLKYGVRFSSGMTMQIVRASIILRGRVVGPSSVFFFTIGARAQGVA